MDGSFFAVFHRAISASTSALASALFRIQAWYMYLLQDEGLPERKALSHKYRLFVVNVAGHDVPHTFNKTDAHHDVHL